MMCCERIDSQLEKSPARMVLAFIVLGSLGLPSVAHAAGSLEHRVKAAYINNFVKFTVWSKEALPDTAQKIVVGFKGGDEVRKAFETYTKGRKVKGRSMEIRKISKGEEAQALHLLFIGDTDEKSSLASVAAAKKSGTLIIGQSKGFARKGGMIELVLVDGKVRFEYNEAAVKKAGLHIQPAILRLGKKVK